MKSKIYTTFEEASPVPSSLQIQNRTLEKYNQLNAPSKEIVDGLIFYLYELQEKR